MVLDDLPLALIAFDLLRAYEFAVIGQNYLQSMGVKDVPSHA